MQSSRLAEVTCPLSAVPPQAASQRFWKTLGCPAWKYQRKLVFVILVTCKDYKHLQSYSEGIQKVFNILYSHKGSMYLNPSKQHFLRNTTLKYDIQSDRCHRRVKITYLTIYICNIYIYVIIYLYIYINNLFNYYFNNYTLP